MNRQQIRCSSVYYLADGSAYSPARTPDVLVCATALSGSRNSKTANPKTATNSKSLRMGNILQNAAGMLDEGLGQY
jgi:hypothetical protein